jgi:hypothetical protein
VFKRIGARRALVGATLWLVSGCQSASFVGHDEKVTPGTTVPLDLQVAFAAGGGTTSDAKLVACVGLPEGWAAPEGTYTYKEQDGVRGVADTEVTAEAQTAFATAGATWHCLTSERVTVDGTTETRGFAHLQLAVPQVAQGAYRVTYLTGFRRVKPPETDDGEPTPELAEEADAGETPTTYQATEFSGRLERLLHVNVAPVTTFDHWKATSFGPTGPAAQAASATYGNGHFLALASEGGLFSSTDGAEWTAFSPTREDNVETAIRVEAPVFVQGKWFALSSGAIVVSSDDAKTWAVAYSDPVPEGAEAGRSFVALASNGTRLVATGAKGLIAVSGDGTTWTDQSATTDDVLVNVVAGQDAFFILGQTQSEGFAAGNLVLRSRTDGSGWDTLQVEAFAGREVRGFASGNGRLMAYTWKNPPETDPTETSDGGVPPPAEPSGILFMSEDRGTTWQPVQGVLPAGTELPQEPVVAFVDDTFVVTTSRLELATVAMLPQLELRASADGRAWTSYVTGAASDFTSTSFATGERTVVGVSKSLSMVANRRAWAGPAFVTEALPYAVVGKAYSASVETSGGGGGTALSLEGTLPAGLDFTAGAISGTPTAAGTSALTVKARDVRGTQTSHAYSLEVVPVLSIAAAEPRTATQGSAYEAPFVTLGGRAPFAWSHTGSLPEGVTGAQRGDAYVFSGTPTATGDFAVAMKVTDSAGQSAERAVSVHVDAAATPAPMPDDESESCGCSGSGAAGFNALGLAALALMRRVRRKK